MVQSYTLEETDINLYKKFIYGDRQAFDTLVIRHRKNLIAFIMRYVKKVDVAEDLAQDTFLYMLINKKEYDFKYTLKTYLYTIAKCRALNYLKNYKGNLPLEEKYVCDQEVFDVDNNLIIEENKEDILNAISKLKREYQIAIYLSDFEEFKYAEICKILNKTMPQVKMLIHRARKNLKKIIIKEGEKYVK